MIAICSPDLISENIKCCGSVQNKPEAFGYAISARRLLRCFHSTAAINANKSWKNLKAVQARAREDDGYL
jgi:hypothetical protein